MYFQKQLEVYDVTFQGGFSFPSAGHLTGLGVQDQGFQIYWSSYQMILGIEFVTVLPKCQCFLLWQVKHLRFLFQFYQSAGNCNLPFSVSSRWQNTPEPSPLLPSRSASLPLSSLSTVSKCFQAEAMVHVFALLVSSLYSFLLGFYAIKFFFHFFQLFMLFWRQDWSNVYFTITVNERSVNTYLLHSF